MQIGNIFIRDGKVILKDVSGEEVPLSAEDALEFRAWTYDHYLDLLAIVHKPKEPMFNATQETHQDTEREQYL